MSVGNEVNELGIFHFLLNFGFFWGGGMGEESWKGIILPFLIILFKQDNIAISV